MSKAGDVAEALLRVLTAHVANADLWEDYYLVAAGGGEDRKQRKKLLEASTRPLLTLVKREGFTYAEVLEIIPVAFQTDHAERDKILDDLRQHVWDNYETDIPF